MAEITRPVGEQFTVTLAADQWDLVVLCVKYVDARAATEQGTHSALAIDRFARKVLRRRLTELLAELAANVPEAGTE